MGDYAKRILRPSEGRLQSYNNGNFFNQLMQKNWSNILALVELLFCIPVANGHVERLFSYLKVIK